MNLLYILCRVLSIEISKPVCRESLVGLNAVDIGARKRFFLHTEARRARDAEQLGATLHRIAMYVMIIQKQLFVAVLHTQNEVSHLEHLGSRYRKFGGRLALPFERVEILVLVIF